MHPSSSGAEPAAGSDSPGGMPPSGGPSAGESPSSRLFNADLAPVPEGERTWGVVNLAALWVGVCVCIPTYTLAAGMISQGMSWQQALLTITLGNLVILVPLLANAHAGTRYGIPFPVLLRSSFGVWGANIPALMRALVACGWFGIQTWIGGSAIYVLCSAIFGFEPASIGERLPVLGLSAGQLACFLLFWLLNIAVIVRCSTPLAQSMTIRAESTAVSVR
ncbi:MAG: cytosine permease, partial [Holophagales bacterium]|nr:cytosine permease [Holophagales bacterium]